MTDGDVIAIKTKFHGVKYDSRLEAMWAVFFESLGISYVSEPEGLDLSGKPYLPDFYLPKQDYIIEVKGEYPDEEAREKGIMLSEDSGKEVFLLHGDIPNPWAEEGVLESPAVACDEKLRTRATPSPYYWTECPKGCSIGYGITLTGRADLLPCKCFDDFYRSLVNRTALLFTAEELRLLWQLASYRFDSPHLCWAYDNARDAYFENGVAYHGRGGDEVRFWAHRPIDEGVEKIFNLVQAINEVSDDPLFEDERNELHSELAEFMRGQLDWRKIGVLNRYLKLHGK
jgi:hypothetical protein